MNVLVTGGGTIAPIDDVRAITNASTGRLSATITESCLKRGHRVVHLCTPTAMLPFTRSASFDLSADPESEHARLERLRVEWLATRERLRPVRLATGTVADYDAMLGEVMGSERVDIAFMAMAVSDYEPEPWRGKLSSEPAELLIRCRPTPKVILTVRDRCPDVFLVGFKLLSHSTGDELIASARRSGRLNRADLTIANDLRDVRAGRHSVYMVPPDDRPAEFLPAGEDLADRIVDRVLQLHTEREAARGVG